MSFFNRLFSKSPADLLSKGDRYMESDCFFDARTCYEDALQMCSADEAGEKLKTVFIERIDSANFKLAERNMQEAEFALVSGDSVKAADHLELVKTLTYDPVLRNKADNMLLELESSGNAHKVPMPASSCGSCSGSNSSGGTDGISSESSMAQHEYYELLIQQLPPDQYGRYAELGENFAYAYNAASRDEHEIALSALDDCLEVLPGDIYWYEKGKVLHRLGKDGESERCLRTAVQLNSSNSLAWLALLLAVRENNIFDETLSIVETMVAGQMFVEQALLVRAEVLESTGDVDGAINQYVELLETAYARAAAERLHEVLVAVGRHSDAAVIVKKYLSKSCH